MIRYKFFKDKKTDQFTDEENLMIAVKGISKAWHWWYGCNAEEKREFSDRIKELLIFTKDNIPIFGYRPWPISMRISALFMHSSSNLLFAVLYALNQIFRIVCPDKANVVLD